MRLRRERRSGDARDSCSIARSSASRRQGQQRAVAVLNCVVETSACVASFEAVTFDELGPIHPTLEPLLLSIGRAVLGAAALEKMLMVEIAKRRADREGLVTELAEDLSLLERRPAGALLRTLERLGIDDDIAERISELIDRRNRLVHGFMEDSRVMAALESGDTTPLVDRVDRIALDCQSLVDEFAPAAFAGIERIFGLSLEQLLDAVRAIGPDSVSDARLREQLAVVQAANVDELRASLRADVTREPATSRPSS